MFPLHDRTRRFLCRGILLLVAVLPTACVFVSCLYAHSSAPAAQARAHLESLLGLPAHVSHASFPRPGATLLENVELNDPESGRSVAKMRFVEIENYADFQLLTLSQPEIDLSQASVLWPIIDRQLRAAGIRQTDIHIVANELTLRWPGGEQTLLDCGAFFQSTVDDHRASFVFRLPNTPAVDPSRQVVMLQRKPDAASSAGTDFDVVVGPLPYSLIATALQHENHLGPNCTFQGKISGSQTPDGWQAELSGELEDVDLHSLVSEQFPHQMSGLANITLNQAVIHAGRLESATGSIHAGPGTVGASLLAAASMMLGLQRGGAESYPGSTAGNPMGYEELSTDFAFNPRGFTLHGTCGDKRSGVVLRQGQQSLLVDSNRGAVPVVAIIKMLVPDSRVQVPATRQTDWLERLLPVPDVIPGDPQAVPQARIRGGKELH
jgi:hypothetical protein